MFTNFLKVTIRNLYREKMYAAINIFGLSVAIACCIILGLYLRSELTYDLHNTRYKEIFRVVNEFTLDGKENTFAVTSISLAPMLAEEYPEIKGFVRFLRNEENHLIKHEDKAFYWENCYYADDNVFDVFTHDIIYGDPETALIDPSSVAISKSFSDKYFGNVNPIGKSLSDESGTYKITLVFADLPENSHLKYDILFSFNKKELAEPDNVTLRNQRLFSFSAYTYLLLPEGYDIHAFNGISDTFSAKHMEEIGKALKLNGTWRSWLQPLRDIHFQSEVGYDLPTGNKSYVFGFLAVAFFILLVACINYMNLATARATRRAKEVGMRKILGSGRIGLMLQFLAESVFFSLIALFFGIVLVELTLNLTPINQLLGKSLTLDLSQGPALFGWMFVLSIVVGLISGIYPAFYLSSILPLSAVLKRNRPAKWNIRLRESLVLVQFIISVGVIACAVLMALQMRYISHKSLGFSKENKLIITLKGTDVINKLPTIKKELLKNGNIQGVAICSSVLGQPTGITLADVENNEGAIEKASIKFISIGEGFIDLMGMKIVAGRDFSKKLLTDVGLSFIVNEAMVRKMGWKDPLGKHIHMIGANGRVIGVVKNFHFASLHSVLDPLVMYKITPGEYTPTEEEAKNIRLLLFIGISGKDVAGTLAFLQDKFAEFDPVHPFKYKFLDDTLDQLYLSEARLMALIGIFAGICILISFMGLFGLAAFTTEQRTKEIGVRKVLGASMLARIMVSLVLAGAVIASLIAYFAMDEWLSGFAYRIGINPMVFLLSAIGAMGVAFITVALQSFRTAQANPVDTLRYE